MELSLLAVLGVLCIVAVGTTAPKIGVPPPLVLVVLGIGISLLPFVPSPIVEIEPEWILAGLLPPLLYSASVSMPAMNFRRDFRAISALSITLVVISSLTLGLFFRWQIPELGLAGGIALGAVLSPTDAVATSIVKRLGVAPRAVAVLDGESMLNDATALVLLRTAIAGTAFVSVWRVGGAFLVSVAIATTIGILVGYGTLWVRRWIPRPAVNTLLSFAVPFVAFQPTEHLGASGLVAVVAAGLVIGQGAPRYLGPTHRLNDEMNWRTIELVLEGALFLLMGLQLLPLIHDVRTDGDDLGFALWLSAAALFGTIVIRTVFVAPLLVIVARSGKHYEKTRKRLEEMQHKLERGLEVRPNRRHQGWLENVSSRVRRILADADYVTSRPLRARDGALLVWAGMRGAVTLAAAQTLPHEMPHRSLLVLIAFLVAAGSLVLQAGSLPWVIRWLKFPAPNAAEFDRERAGLVRVVQTAAHDLLGDSTLRRKDGAPYEDAAVEHVRGRVVMVTEPDEEDTAIEELVQKVLDAQRASLLVVRAEGTFSSESLSKALSRIDSLQIALQLRRKQRHGHEH